jgi:hypothetical protein
VVFLDLLDDVQFLDRADDARDGAELGTLEEIVFVRLQRCRSESNARVMLVVE